MLQSVPPAPAQPPQLALSVVVSTQSPWHMVEPSGQDPVHAPLLQKGIDPEHIWPQLPQLVESTRVLAHVPAQLSVVATEAQHAPPASAAVESGFDVSPAGQDTVQLPLLQKGAAAAHAFLQPPQLLGSTSVSTQVPSQLSAVVAAAQQTLAAPIPLESGFEACPVGHETVQAPLAHSGIAPPHAWPQLPQLLASNAVLMQVPPQLSVATPGAQHASPASAPVESFFEASPAAQVHWPPLHACPAEHTFPQAPQLLSSL